MSDENEIKRYEWTDGKFCYETIGGGRQSGIQRGGVGAGVRVFAGVFVCNDAAVVRELLRLVNREQRLVELLRESLPYLDIEHTTCINHLELIAKIRKEIE